jgi:hypothetical protein
MNYSEGNVICIKMTGIQPDLNILLQSEDQPFISCATIYHPSNYLPQEIWTNVCNKSLWQPITAIGY